MLALSVHCSLNCCTLIRILCARVLFKVRALLLWHPRGSGASTCDYITMIEKLRNKLNLTRQKNLRKFCKINAKQKSASKFHLTGLIITLSTTFSRILNVSHINNVFCIVNVFLRVEVSRVLALHTMQCNIKKIS